MGANETEAARVALQVLDDARELEEAIKALEHAKAGGRTISLEDLATDLGINLK
jgi:hypothetical protein